MHHFMCTMTLAYILLKTLVLFQFLVTGSYFGLMGLAFIITAAYRLCRFITNR